MNNFIKNLKRQSNIGALPPRNTAPLTANQVAVPTAAINDQVRMA
jgi:hypothetical protein